MSKNSRLFKIFENKFVSIITRMKMEKQTSSGDMIEIIKTPVSINGYLVDSDDKFYYLGHSPDSINQAIPHTDVAHIEVVAQDAEIADVMEQLLLNGEIPPEDKFN